MRLAFVAFALVLASTVFFDLEAFFLATGFFFAEAFDFAAGLRFVAFLAFEAFFLVGFDFAGFFDLETRFGAFLAFFFVPTPRSYQIAVECYGVVTMSPRITIVGCRQVWPPILISASQSKV